VARRRVERTEAFLVEALRYFPAEATSRRNSFAVLDEIILKPLEEALAWPGRFEKLTPAQPGSPIRLFVTQHAFIPPVVIYVGQAHDTVYLLAFECDLDYWALIEDDPDN
jgi:hypothetical protein